MHTYDMETMEIKDKTCNSYEKMTNQINISYNSTTDCILGP